MSLLMDALRKAEESKKQAEQQDKKPDETGLPASQEEPVGTATPDLEVSTSSIPDTQLEFEESPGARVDDGAVNVAESEDAALSTTKESKAPASDPLGESPAEPPQEIAAKEVGTKAAKQEATSATVALSLEPMDESAQSSARKHLDVSAAPDYSAESQLKSAGTAESKSEKAAELPSSASATKPSTSDNVQQDLEAAILRANTKFAGASKPKDAPDESRSTLRPAPTGHDYAVGKEPKLDEFSVSMPTGEQENSNVTSKPAAGSVASSSAASKNLENEGATATSEPGQVSINPQNTDAAQPGSKLKKPDQGISARSAPDRRAARSVFAAKRRGMRFRIRRSTKIWALQIAAVIALLGVGYVFFLATAPSNQFNVPTEYLSNTGSFSDDFINEDFVDDVTVAISVESELEPGVEPAIAQSAMGLQDQVMTAVIGEPETTTPATAAELSQALPAQAATLAVLDEEVIPAPQSATAEERVVTPEDASAGVVESAALATVAGAGTTSAPLDTASETENTTPVALPPGISFVRRESASTVDPMLRQAYEAYQRGELSIARALYQQVLEESPQQRDAMLGLAAIASANQDAVAAMQLYSGLLARDPSDSVARAGLLALRPAGSIADQEREFRRLMTQQGNVAAVVYAVGNFYATQRRWNEAQRYYFNALQLAKADELNGIPVNPDYAFNLAVSLERINQADAAGTYYQEAITFADSHAASFDLSIARSRLASLAEVGS